MARTLSEATAALHGAVDRCERRFGIGSVAVATAALGLALACLRVKPLLWNDGLGYLYVDMANDPWRHSAEGYRILTPLLAHYLGFRGDHLASFNLAIAGALVAVVYLALRRWDVRPASSVLGALAIALSIPVLFNLRYGGYTDPLSYVLLVGMLCVPHRPTLYWTLYLLDLLNRDAALFLLPFALAYAWWQGPRVRATPLGASRIPPAVAQGGTDVPVSPPPLEDRSQVVASAEKTETWWKQPAAWRSFALAAAAIALYLLFRFLYRHNIGEPGYDGAYYLDPMKDDPLFWLKQSLEHYPIGVLGTFSCFWIYAIVALAGPARQAIAAAAAIVGAAAQTLVAHDVTRLYGLALPAVLFGMVAADRRWRHHVWVLAILLAVQSRLPVWNVFSDTYAPLPGP